MYRYAWFYDDSWIGGRRNWVVARNSISLTVVNNYKYRYKEPGPKHLAYFLLFVLRKVNFWASGFIAQRSAGAFWKRVNIRWENHRWLNKSQYQDSCNKCSSEVFYWKCTGAVLAIKGMNRLFKFDSVQCTIVHSIYAKSL